MFPYNDEENDWISGNKKNEASPLAHSLIYSILFALFVALFSTALPPLIYFSRTNLS
tara:strand:+ start:1306 stop:1476 length:171 start_codon:yes stop_codon:yes gene_type:complete